MGPKYGQLSTVLDKTYLLINWSDIEEMIIYLGDRILAKPRRPNLFLSVCRNGVTVGNLLTDLIYGKSTSKRDYEIIPIRCRTWSNTNGRPPTDEDFEVLQGLPQQYQNLENFDVEGTDDVIDTGTTWDQLKKKIIEPARPRSFDVVSLHVKDWSKFTPETYAEMIPHDWWIFYGWELREVTESAYTMQLKNGRNFSDAEIELRRAFDYLYNDFKPNTIDRIFEHIRKQTLSTVPTPTNFVE